MAYKPQEIKIAPNGLNLLAPGDAVPDGDCLDLTGFWPGAVGRLQQAPGYANLSAAHLAGYFDSLCQCSGRTYYGGGGNLHQVGRGGGGETAIDTGYDGYPLGMIACQGYQWIMNRSKQRKDNGTTVTDWTPAPPALPALTNPAVTSGALTVVECDPANPGTAGVFQQINMWTSSSIAGLEVGALITIAGNATAAMNATWLVTAIFQGSPNSLIQMQANLPAGTVYGLGGTFVFANPGMPLGAQNYYITWQYTDLGESNPCSVAGVITPVTVNVTGPGTKVHLSIAALTPPAGAVGWNVYRQSPGSASPYRVNLDMIPIATTSYDDFGDAAHVQDDDYLTSTLGIIMEGDHDAAPPARIVGNQVYNGRIVVANSAAYPNRVWYTPALQPGFFRGSGNPQAGDWVDIGTDRGDEILLLAVKPGQIIVYRAKSIWRILGDFQDPNGRIDVVVPDLGIVGPRAVACTSLGDYFRAPEGIYKFNGDWAQKASAKIEPVFLGQARENFAAEDPAYRSNCALGFHAGRLWVSYTWSGQTQNCSSFILHQETDRWFSRGIGVGAFLDAGSTFLAAGSIYVNTIETGYQDGVGSTIVAYQSAYEDCGFPDHEKTFADLVASHNTGGQTLTVRCRTNKGAAATDVFDLDTTITSASLTKQTIPLVYPAAYSIVGLRGQPIRAYNLSIRITGWGANAGPGIEIDTPLILHYYLEARKALVFDTDETDHGIPGVTKTVDMVEFDIDSSSGPGSLQIYSNIPGGTMVARLGSGVAIAQTTGRSTVRIVIPAPIDGKLLRYVATTTTGFSVYGFRARITPIGVYLDGSIAETWDTRPISIAA